MRKKLFAFLSGFALCLLIVVPSSVKTAEYLYDTLIQELGFFPSIEERIPLYEACGFTDEYHGSYEQNIDFNQCLAPVEYLEEICEGIPCDELLGASGPRRPTEFKSSLNEQKTEGHSDTTIVVTTITTKDGNTLDPNVLGDVIAITINPGRSNSETALCTDLTVATKTFTGCTFGYRFDDPSATQAANIKPHSPGEPVIISNTDVFLQAQYFSLDGAHTITGTSTWSGIQSFTVFPVFSTAVTATGSEQFVTKRLLDATSFQGTTTSTESSGGISELATQIEMASSTNLGADIPLVLQARYATSTCQVAQLQVVITENDGKISTGCIDQTSVYAWTGANTHSGQETFTATTTFATTTIAEANIVTTTIQNQLTLLGKDANPLATSSSTDAQELHYHAGNMATGNASRVINSTGNQTVIHNLGVIPSYITIQAYTEANNASTASSYGTATSTASQYTTWFTRRNSGAGSNQYNHGQNLNIINLEEATGSAGSGDEAIASLTALNANTFVINWSVNDNSGGTRFFTWSVFK